MILYVRWGNDHRLDLHRKIVKRERRANVWIGKGEKKEKRFLYSIKPDPQFNLFSRGFFFF